MVISSQRAILHVTIRDFLKQAPVLSIIVDRPGKPLKPPLKVPKEDCKQPSIADSFKPGKRTAGEKKAEEGEAAKATAAGLALSWGGRTPRGQGH